MRSPRTESPGCKTLRVRFAVVGHVEWVEFARVERVPSPGEIVHATDSWAEPAGGGAVAAAQLARLGGAATFFTALGDDELGHRAAAGLGAMGIDVDAVFRPEPQRRAFTFVDAAAERTITVIGERAVPHGDDDLPWATLGGFDAVYVTGGDPDAIRAARRARILTATPRTLAALQAAAIRIDALVGSGRDRGERYAPGELTPEPELVVRTAGARGGTYVTASGETGAFPAAFLATPPADAYGCGDSFAAGLTYGLGAGMTRGEAFALAARCGAEALCRRGAYGGAPGTTAA